MIADGCGADCQGILNQYSNEEAHAAVCDPAVDSCAIELPTVYGLEQANGSFVPEGLASNCNGAFNPTRSTTLRSLYAQYQAQGCKEAPVPICGSAADAGECVQAPSGYSPTGYTCENH